MLIWKFHVNLSSSIINSQIILISVHTLVFLIGSQVFDKLLIFYTTNSGNLYPGTLYYVIFQFLDVWYLLYQC